jgi:ABC-type multidrug transport system fused ATPase/permease subunit
MHSSLWTCYAKSCWKIFIISGIFKLFGDLCGLIGPLSISYIVDFINLQTQQYENASGAGYVNEIPVASGNFHNETTNIVSAINNRHSMVGWSEFIQNGWIMSCIVLISFLLQGTFSQASTHLVNMEGIKIKNALQGLIFRKMLLLNVSCCFAGNEAKKEDENSITKGDKKGKKDVSVEDDNCDVNNPGTITNLMSEDSLNVMSFYWIAHYVWSIPLKVRKVLKIFSTTCQNS